MHSAFSLYRVENLPVCACVFLCRALQSIHDDRYGFPFRQPVDTVQFSDYLSYVKRPMDIQTILHSYKDEHYTTVQQFIGECLRSLVC